MKKHIIRAMLLVISIIGAVTLNAYAVEYIHGISVIADGKTVTFTDAAPVAMSGRTYVPFRAIFETLGADVDYVTESKTVVAVKGDTTVRFVIGDYNVTVVENGTEKTVVTDAKSFAMNNRTFVPVRFAAQCLGYNVGWDQAKMTAVITDPRRIAEEVAGEFSCMDQYIALARETAKHGGNRLRGSYRLATELFDEAGTAYDTAGTFEGVREGRELSADIRLESNLSALFAGLDKESAQQNAQLMEALENMELSYYETRQTAYVKGEIFNLLAGTQGDLWYQVDNERGMDIIGGSVTAVSSQMEQIPWSSANMASYDDTRDLIAACLRDVEVTSCDSTALQDTAKRIGAALCDGQFTEKNGVSTISLQEETAAGETYALTISVTASQNGAAAGRTEYTVSGPGTERCSVVVSVKAEALEEEIRLVTEEYNIYSETKVQYWNSAGSTIKKPGTDSIILNWDQIIAL